MGGFDDAAGIHHVYPVSVARHDAEVVGYQQQRGIVVGDLRLEQFEQLRLNSHVERGGRLVGDNHVRHAAHPHGDHDALTHAAAELVGIGAGAQPRLGDVDGG